MQYDFIQKHLELFGTPPDIINWNMKLHSNFQVVLKVGKEEISAPFICGVKKEIDKLPPCLLL